MQNLTKEKRSEPRVIIDEPYSMELIVRDVPFLFSSRVWDVSLSGRSLLVRDDSVLLKQLKIRDKIRMRYWKTEATRFHSSNIEAEIKHITKHTNRRMGGNHLVGIYEFLI